MPSHTEQAVKAPPENRTIFPVSINQSSTGLCLLTPPSSPNEPRVGCIFLSWPRPPRSRTLQRFPAACTACALRAFKVAEFPLWQPVPLTLSCSAVPIPSSLAPACALHARRCAAGLVIPPSRASKLRNGFAAQKHPPPPTTRTPRGTLSQHSVQRLLERPGTLISSIYYTFLSSFIYSCYCWLRIFCPERPFVSCHPSCSSLVPKLNSASRKCIHSVSKQSPFQPSPLLLIRFETKISSACPSLFHACPVQPDANSCAD